MGAQFEQPNYDETESKPYEIPNEVAFPSRCIGIVELGTHPNTHKEAPVGAMKKELMIIWELSKEMEDGRLFTVNWRGTNTMGKGGNLIALLQSWRNADFTEEQRKTFTVDKVLGVLGMLTVKHKPSKGKIYANIGSLVPLPEAMATGLIDQKNPTTNFGICDLGNKEEFAKIWPYVQDIIAKSEEGKAYAIDHPEFFIREKKVDENKGTNVGKDTGTATGGEKFEADEEPPF